MTVTAPVYGQDVAAEWRPWRALRGLDDVELELCDLPGEARAIYAQRGEDRAILIDRRLSPTERLAALAHELVHLERGGGCHQRGAPAPLAIDARKEERRVDDEVARRLVPFGDLAEFVDMLIDCGETVTVALVADEFDVTEGCARIAMEQLLRDMRRLAG